MVEFGAIFKPLYLNNLFQPSFEILTSDFGRNINTRSHRIMFEFGGHGYLAGLILLDIKT